MSFVKIYLPIYLLIYLLIAFVLPTYRTFKKTGINPVTFGKSDNAHDYIGFLMKLLVALLFVVVLIFSFSERAYNYLVPIEYLEVNYLQITGLIIIHISLGWISVAQYQMGNSWRIGIDENNKTGLVTKGIFSLSRNPIFLGMIVSVLGVFFIIPNALTFFLTLTTYFIIQIQIRLEEEFLTKEHGSQYQKYKQKTKRLL
ncbi:isoprenylcysteine carboxylmethyltransferase family protein [Flavobacterium filum]|jgi:protein-S-isoprenylcysteine O-methyltransferase Ste14|uniref:methyltransferase family protein n=1 Tax=Flavobacterium filum TaxID=370974 RepID=UPI0023F21EC8|nr:isoprenylcysteine carboxylmethyltransferase family protein [Flavobacterium filum]